MLSTTAQGLDVRDLFGLRCVKDLGQLTWDRRTELAQYTHYTKIQTALETTLYFCDPHSPWQRGTNENTPPSPEVLVRKGSDLSTHTPEELRQLAAKLNHRPRPTLNLETPANRLNQILQTAA